MRLGTKIQAKDVDVLYLINTLDLYGLINDGINKYNERNTVQGFINVMVGNTNVPTVVESSYKTIAASKLGKTKPVIVHGNNYGNTKLADTGLKSNNILGAHIEQEKEGWFYGWDDTMVSGTITTIHLRKRMNRGAHTRSWVTTAFLNSPKPSTTVDQKQDL